MLMVPCLSPFLGGFLGSALSVCIVGLVLVVSERRAQAPAAHDPEREIQRITFRLRHPWRARIRRWMEP